jgi:hypothetical protein
MKAWIVVSETPHVSVSDLNGQISFRQIAPGEYDMTLWHDKIGAVKQIDLGNARLSRSEKGSTVRLDGGSGDFGRIVLASRLFDIN